MPRRVAHAASIALAILAAIALQPSASSAQESAAPFVDAVGAWADSESLRRLLPGSGGVGRTSRPRATKPKRPTARQVAALRFARDPAITQEGYEQVIANLGAGYEREQVVAELDRVRGLYHEQLGELGWSPNDAGDVATFTIIFSYVVYHRNGDPSRRVSTAVRRTVRDGLASAKRIRRAPDATLQRASERLELRMPFLTTAHLEAEQARDANALTIAKADIRRWIRDVFGVDIARVKLTSKGLISP